MTKPITDELRATLDRFGALMWAIWYGDFDYANDLAEACRDPRGHQFRDFERSVETNEDEEWQPQQSHKIYFLQSGLIGAIKIGYSGDIEKRFKGLRYASAEPVHLLGWIYGGPEAEGRLHERFAPYRQHGEWFRPVDELLEFVRDNARPA